MPLFLLVAVGISTFCELLRGLLDVNFTPGPRPLFSPISALGAVLPSCSLNPGTQWFWKWRHEAYFNRSHDVIAFVPWMIGSPAYYVSSLDVMKQLLSAKNKIHLEKPQDLTLARLWGHSVTSANGDVWRRHRRVVSPAFNSKTYSEVWKTVRNAYQEMMDTEGWTRRNELVFDEINSLVLKFTFIIICRCGFTFSTPWSATRSETDNFPDALRLVSETLIPRLVIPNWVYSLPFERHSQLSRTILLVNEDKNGLDELDVEWVAWASYKYDPAAGCSVLTPDISIMDVIQDIRRSLELDKEVPSVLSECVECSLELLTDQLYNADTHFLLELVQNAEDNEYKEAIPTLRISITDYAITLSCNEAGFSESNVRAICKIGASTKKNISGFIGEKGIGKHTLSIHAGLVKLMVCVSGFKSVFKIADIVHVASGPYTFKFDRKERLGMIAPIWDPSRKSKSGWTTFYLDLSSRQKRQITAFNDMISAIKPSLLLFLTKLRSIELEIKIDSKGATRSINIERTDLEMGFIQLTHTENGVLLLKDVYFMFKRTIDMSNVPNDTRRGADSTEIILAFPVDENQQPRVRPQDVHAFLPVRKFGFNFVIHGDFLTSSSREDILVDSLWNLNIRNTIVDTFIAAIQSFQDRSGLRDKWIRYLPNGIVYPFFSPVEKGLVETLKTMQVVKDHNEVLRRPNDVLRIPSIYRYKAGPLIEERFMKFWYLSDEYDASTDIPVLERLGVRTMTSEDFLSAVAAMDTAYLSRRDNAWHETVCLELSRNYQLSRSQFNKYMSEARILPLDDGSWSQVRDASKFVFESDVSRIPNHVNLRRIHHRVHPSSSPRQYELYRILGVRQVDLVYIAERILDYKGPLSVQQHVSNASFFFVNRFSSPELPSPSDRLLVVDEGGTTSTGNKLYLDLPDDQGMLRRILPSPARFVHSAYIQEFENRQRKDWLRWLHDELHLNTAPRVISMHLSPEFKKMLTTARLSETLKALKYFWTRLPVRSGVTWLKELGQHPVSQDDGTRCALDSMCLKRGMMSRCSGISFVPVADPESSSWDFLRLVGVTVEPDVAFFVKLLIQYQSQDLINEKEVVQIYKQLDARFYEDEARIIAAFRKHPLIYVRDAAKGPNWRRMSDVYWNGPKAMTSKTALQRVYGELGEFFQEKLGLIDAPPTVLVDELKILAEEWKDKCIRKDVHKTVSAMIVKISRLVESRALNESSAKPLLQLSIFPTRHSETGIRLQKLRDIYIPDYTGYYARLFRDKVPLLELSDTESGLPIINDLLQLASDDMLHYLDKCIDHKMELRGSPRLHGDLTATYCGRYQDFERLVYDNKKHTDRHLEYLSKLKEMSVFAVDGISSEFSIHDLCAISTDTELVQIREDESSIIAYVSESALHPIGENTIHKVYHGICKRLADMLGCNFELLLLCVTLPSEVFDTILREKGIGSVVMHPADANDEWLQMHISGVSSSITSKLSTRLSRRGDSHDQNRHRMVSSSDISSIGRFSMTSLETEIDLVMQTIPEFSNSSHLVIRSRRMISANLSRFVASTARYATMPLTESLLPDVLGYGKRSTDAQYPIDNQSYAHEIPLSTHHISISASNIGFRAPSICSPALSQPSFYQQVNGFLGERYVYELLSTIIGPTFGPQNWTSELRRLYPGFDAFEGSSLADFTYKDCEGILTGHLFKDDPDTVEQWNGVHPTYHIEVKATSSGSREPFSMSQRQLQIVIRFFIPCVSLLTTAFQGLSMFYTYDKPAEDGEKHVYVLIRVWDVRNPSPRSHAIYVDPLHCILNDSLKIVSEKLELMVGE
ncbi:hypothetical protein A7U60_g7774 [Sanghuangporus baumii]|uniref:Protein NO VEIN C-terminal domain-containing protein n=1 Tax=Sanghuangporus baumii TaxID=108892 RepID=A0A9Q5HSE4_SANBA|nr:hypothetical protein A7U60_g7774 [Sanghuangporus baumii]